MTAMTPSLATHRSPERLTRFSTMQHHYGIWFSSCAWQFFGCVTFAQRTNAEGATRRFKAYVDRLRRAIGGGPISYVAVLERSWSGLGKPGCHWHWHFLLAGPPCVQAQLLFHAVDLWARYGESQIDPYDPARPGAFYIAKQVSREDAHWETAGMERMTFAGPTDLWCDQQTNAFVPEHARPFGGRLETLVMRPIRKSAGVENLRARALPSGQAAAEGSRLRNRGGSHGRRR